MVYQVYPRSFADSDGDGIGDLAGLRDRLLYLADLGVDAIWLTPFYPSPLADGGYDVSDYTDVDPRLGTLAGFDALVETARERGIRVIVDLVPNHCSAEHPLFKKALAAGPGSSEREMFIFREGRGPDGSQPPNNWPSNFGGPAWTRVADGQWYLHLFDSGQPDWNWRNPQVPAMFEDVIRFWLDRGVAGLRVDVAHGMFKDPELADDPDRRCARTSRPATTTARRSTSCTGPGAPSWTATRPTSSPARAPRSARSGTTATTRCGRTWRRTGCRRCSTSSWSPRSGTRRGSAPRSTRRCRCPAGHAPRG